MSAEDAESGLDAFIQTQKMVGGMSAKPQKAEGGGGQSCWSVAVPCSYAQDTEAAIRVECAQRCTHSSEWAGPREPVGFTLIIKHRP